jgi:hypothetical protein
VHVTALEKDINGRRPEAQGLVIEFGGDQILLAIPGIIRNAHQFAPYRIVIGVGALPDCAYNCAEHSFDIHRVILILRIVV